MIHSFEHEDPISATGIAVFASMTRPASSQGDAQPAATVAPPHSEGITADVTMATSFKSLPAPAQIARPEGLIGFWQIRTLLNEISSLRAMQAAGGVMASCFVDAFEFAGALPWDIPSPSVWTDGESEVVFEWIGARDHAVVSLEGGGLLGYTYKKDNEFIPGQVRSAGSNKMPADLEVYLRSFV